MILIQAAIPLGCVFGLFFALWFLFDLRLRGAGSDVIQTETAASRRKSARLFGRFAPIAAVAALVNPVVVGLVGWAHGSMEAAGYVALAGGLGILFAFVVWMASLGVSTMATSRTAAAIESEADTKPVFSALWGSATLALIGGAIGIGVPVALFGAYTAGMDVVGTLAPQYVIGFAAGVVAVAAGAQLSSAGYLQVIWDDPSGTSTGAFRGAADSTLSLIAMLSLAVAATSAPSAVLWMTTGEAAWMLLPAAVLAFGLFASALGALSFAFWTRLSSPISSVRAGFWTVIVLSAVAAVAAPLALPDTSIFFGLAAVSGVAAAALLFGVLPADRGNVWPMIVAGVLIVGALAGWAADVNGIAVEYGAALGAALGAAGFLMPAAYIAAVSGAASVTEEASSIADRGDLDALDEFRGWADAKSGAYSIASVVIVAGLAVLAMLAVVRSETSRAALDDPGAYLQVATDLDLLPDASEFRAEIAVRLEGFSAYVDGFGRVLSEEEQAFLFSGYDSDIRAMAATKLADDQLTTEEADALVGGPLPLPRLLPWNLVSIPGFTGLIVGFAAVGTTLSILRRARRTGQDGTSFNLVPVLGSVLFLLVVPGVALATRFVEGSVGGWQLGIGSLIGVALAAAAMGSRGSAYGPVGRTAGAAALMVIATLLAIAPVLVA